MHLGYVSATGECEVPAAASPPLQEDSVEFVSLYIHIRPDFVCSYWVCSMVNMSCEPSARCKTAEKQKNGNK